MCEDIFSRPLCDIMRDLLMDTFCMKKETMCLFQHICLMFLFAIYPGATLAIMHMR